MFIIFILRDKISLKPYLSYDCVLDCGAASCSIPPYSSSDALSTLFTMRTFSVLFFMLKNLHSVRKGTNGKQQPTQLHKRNTAHDTKKKQNVIAQDMSREHIKDADHKINLAKKCFQDQTDCDFWSTNSIQLGPSRCLCQVKLDNDGIQFCLRCCQHRGIKN